MDNRHLGDWIDAYIEYTAETEPPVIFRKWVALGILSGTLNRKCFFRWHSKIYPNIYVVLVSPPGRARKGTALSSGFDFLESTGANIAASSTTREALIRFIKNSTSKVIDPISNEEVDHSCVTIWSEELTSFIGAMANPQLLTDLTDWYDCGKGSIGLWDYDTKTQGRDRILGICITLLAGTTPEVLQAAIPTNLIGGGFSSRVFFIFARAKGKKVIYPYMNIEEEDRLKPLLLDDIADISLIQGQMKPDADWIDLYGSWYNSCSEGSFNCSKLAAYEDRRQTHLMKLSMIFSASNSNNMVVTGAHFKKALTTMEEAEAQMPFVFGGVGKNKNAPTINSVMLTIADAKEISFTELLQDFYTDIDSRELGELIGTLKRIGFCTIESKEGSYIIKHNPDYDQQARKKAAEKLAMFKEGKL